MTTQLQIILIIFSLITFAFVILKIRKAQLEIANAIVWIILSLTLILMTLLSPFVTKIAKMLGFYSTINFVFTMILFLLILIEFSQTVKISILNEKVKNLNHYIALKEKKEYEKKAKNDK